MSWRALGRVLLAAGGLAAVGGLIHHAGIERVGAVLALAGRWAPLIIALELAQIAADILSLRAILRERSRQISPQTWARSSALAYALMILVPAGRAAGEVGRAALLARHLGAPRAAAASTKLQAAYLAANGALSAAAWAAVASEHGARAPLALLLFANVVFQALLAGGLMAILWHGSLGRWLDRMRQRWVPGAKEAPPLESEARRGLPWGAFAWCTLARAAQLAQYGTLLYAVGGAWSVRNAFVAHGIHLVGASLGDLIPNQLGVVDGVYAAFAGALGFDHSPARAISIALVAHMAQLIIASACVLFIASTRRTRASGEGGCGLADEDAGSSPARCPKT